MKALGSLAIAATTPNALDTKTKELMALAISIAVRCGGCVAYHTLAAMKAGASRQEAVETVALAVCMAGARLQSMAPMRPARSMSTQPSEDDAARAGVRASSSSALVPMPLIVPRDPRVVLPAPVRT